MEFYVNDLSIAGQFPDVQDFIDAIERVMQMRDIARQFGRELYCHRNITSAQVTRNHTMQQAIQLFDRNKQRTVMQWFTRTGPFWEDDRQHNDGDYLECRGEIVTNTAIGEAAYCCFHGATRHLISLTPSDWEFTPISVDWILDSEHKRNVAIENHWEPSNWDSLLQSYPPQIMSWDDLADVCRDRCPHLTFAEDSFGHLRGHPYNPGAADRIRILLDTLEMK